MQHLRHLGKTVFELKQFKVLENSNTALNKLLLMNETGERTQSTLRMMYVANAHATHTCTMRCGASCCVYMCLRCAH
ncbi:hypothetical protein EON66_03640 [archaeon]|nr:MAG: hypothetical protein EON66_03640 [archaeon]